MAGARKGSVFLVAAAGGSLGRRVYLTSAQIAGLWMGEVHAELHCKGGFGGRYWPRCPPPGAQTLLSSLCCKVRASPRLVPRWPRGLRLVQALGPLLVFSHARRRALRQHLALFTP